MKPDVIGTEYVPCSYIRVDFVVTLLRFKPCLQDLADWNDRLVIVEDFMDNTSHSFCIFFWKGWYMLFLEGIFIMESALICNVVSDPLCG